MKDNLRLDIPAEWCVVSPPTAPSSDCANLPVAVQVGGDHYTKMKIQPVEYIHANGLGFLEGNVVKYVSRWKDKGGIADLKKAVHCIELLIDLESK